MSSNDIGTSIEAVAGRTWYRACSIEQIPEDEGLVLSTVPKTSVFHSDGEVFCIDDTCTHEDYSLAQGWVEDYAVECTLHLARFSLRTGAPLTPPANRPVATHPAVLTGGDVYVALPESYLVKQIGHGLA